MSGVQVPPPLPKLPLTGHPFGEYSVLKHQAARFFLAAVTLLPALDQAGFQSGAASNPPEALWLLTLLYAALPCVLKAVAIALLAATQLKEG